MSAVQEAIDRYCGGLETYLAIKYEYVTGTSELDSVFWTVLRKRWIE
jgi:hypothetical protein